MTSDTKSPTPEKPEQQQKIAPQADELVEDQLDKAVGGVGGGHVGPSGPGG
jgi:hypothetical protein